MDFLLNINQPLPGEAIVAEMGKLAGNALANFQSDTAKLFTMMWSAPSSIQDKLNRMGNRAALIFSQHKDAVLLILKAHIREQFWILGNVPVETLQAALTMPIEWLYMNQSDPLAVAVLNKMPLETFIPPVEFIVHDDGTITIV